MPLLGLRVEARGIAAIGEMLGAFARIEAHRVEVGHRDGPALGFERRRSGADEMRVERLRFGVREDEVSVHHAALTSVGTSRVTAAPDIDPLPSYPAVQQSIVIQAPETPPSPSPPCPSAP